MEVQLHVEPTESPNPAPPTDGSVATGVALERSTQAQATAEEALATAELAAAQAQATPISSGPSEERIREIMREEMATAAAVAQATEELEPENGVIEEPVDEEPEAPAGDELEPKKARHPMMVLLLGR